MDQTREQPMSGKTRAWLVVALVVTIGAWTLLEPWALAEDGASGDSAGTDAAAVHPIVPAWDASPEAAPAITSADDGRDADAQGRPSANDARGAILEADGGAAETAAPSSSAPLSMGGASADSKAVEVLSASRSAPATRPAPIRFGLGADVGVSGLLPDLGVLLVMRPMTWLRAQVGGGHNGLAFGIRAGVTLINPLVIPVSLTCEGGHYFAGNANQAVQWLRNDAPEVASLRRLSYDYLNLLGGLETTGGNLSVYVRGGVTWMRATVRDFEQSMRETAQIEIRAADPKVRYRGPALKLGMVYFF
jgi:hypothetical protein